MFVVPWLSVPVQAKFRVAGVLYMLADVAFFIGSALLGREAVSAIKDRVLSFIESIMRAPIDL